MSQNVCSLFFGLDFYVIYFKVLFDYTEEI